MEKIAFLALENVAESVLVPSLKFHQELLKARSQISVTRPHPAHPLQEVSMCETGVLKLERPWTKTSQAVATQGSGPNGRVENVEHLPMGTDAASRHHLKLYPIGLSVGSTCLHHGSK